MLVYIHVPFCRSRCRYCAFHSLPLGPASPDSSPRVAAYRDSLLRELDLWAARLGRRPVESVFFGGGTPSLLPPDFQAAVLERIDRHFHLAAGAEISMEANPESLLARRAVDAYLAAGINRISMGVQSMDDSFLSLLGRPHRRADVLRAVEHLRPRAAAIWGWTSCGACRDRRRPTGWPRWKTPLPWSRSMSRPMA